MISFVEFVGLALPTGVAVVIGTSIQDTVISFCNDIVAPLCSYTLRTGELDSLGVQLGDNPTVILNYGAFLQSMITFIFTLLIVYILIILFQNLLRVDLIRKLK